MDSVDSTYRVFARQEDAIEFIKTVEGLRLWSEDQQGKNKVYRRFIVASVNGFAARYPKMQKKNFYEVISDSDTCKLHLDIEYMKEVNKNINSDDIVLGTRGRMIAFLREKYKIELTEEHVVILDASNNKNFSCHMIFNGALIKKNTHCNMIVDQFITENKDFLTINDINGKSNCIIDVGIYTIHRNFRLYQSSKIGEERPFTLSKFDLSFGSFQNLIGEGQEIERLFLEYSLVTETRRPTNIALLEEKKDNQKHTVKFKSTKSHSQFPDIDIIVEANIGSGKITTCEMKPNGSIFYSISGTRYCHIAGREHRHSNIYVKVNANRSQVIQLCYSPKCFGKHFVLQELTNQ